MIERHRLQHLPEHAPVDFRNRRPKSFARLAG